MSSSDNWTPLTILTLEEAPFPLNKSQLIDWAIRSGLDAKIIDNLQLLEDDGQVYHELSDIWPEYEPLDYFTEEDEENW